MCIGTRTSMDSHANACLAEPPSVAAVFRRGADAFIEKLSPVL